VGGRRAFQQVRAILRAFMDGPRIADIPSGTTNGRGGTGPGRTGSRAATCGLPWPLPPVPSLPLAASEKERARTPSAAIGYYRGTAGRL